VRESEGPSWHVDERLVYENTVATAPAMSDHTYPWRAFAALVMLGEVAVVLATPRPLSGTVFAVAGAVVAGVVGVGLAAGRPFGLGAPLLQRLVAGEPLPVGAGKGCLGSFLAGAALGGGVLAALRFFLVPAEPVLLAPFADEARQPSWKQWVIAFDSAVLEEILFRLLFVSTLVWLLRRLGSVHSGPPAGWTFWLPSLASALGFALVHVPRWLSLAPGNSAVVVIAMTLNGTAGMLFGFLYLRRGIESAMIAHFAADVVLHVLGPGLLLE
jgi:hypothetical protein